MKHSFTGVWKNYRSSKVLKKVQSSLVERKSTGGRESQVKTGLLFGQKAKGGELAIYYSHWIERWCELYLNKVVYKREKIKILPRFAFSPPLSALRLSHAPTLLQGWDTFWLRQQGTLGSGMECGGGGVWEGAKKDILDFIIPPKDNSPLFGSAWCLEIYNWRF